MTFMNTYENSRAKVNDILMVDSYFVMVLFYYKFYTATSIYEWFIFIINWPNWYK